MSTKHETLLLLMCIYCVFCDANTFETDNKTYWRSTSLFKPISSRSYGLIEIGSGMHMEFKIIYHGRSTINKWENIFRIGYKSDNGNNCYHGGSRFPSFWIVSTMGTFDFSISDQDNCFRSYTQYQQLRNIEYSIIIDYNQTWIYIQINDEIHINQSRQFGISQDLIGTFAHIWFSTDLHQTTQVIAPANVTIYDILIEPYGLPSTSPTISPTVNPTVNNIHFIFNTDSKYNYINQ